jgi:RHS repeat-associated protein
MTMPLVRKLLVCLVPPPREHRDYAPLSAAPEVGERYRYMAQKHDADTTLVNHRTRYRDPSVGRCLAEDPIGFAAGDSNLYRYVAR